MRPARPLALLFSIAVLAFAAASCGGGGGSSASGTKPETWSASVCGALQTWSDDLKTGSQNLSADLRKSSGLKSVKQKLVAFLESAEKSTEKMVQDVKAAGAPAVKDGPAIQSDLANGLTQAENSFKRAVAKAKKLPTNDSAALATGLTSLGTQIQSELTSTGQHFSNLENKYDVGDLNKAMAGEQACKPFVSSSSSD